MNNKIKRNSFELTLAEFTDYLSQNELSADILWLCKGRLTGHKTNLWVFRPGDLVAKKPTAKFYESLYHTENSIRFDVLMQYDKKSLCYVQNFGGDSGSLNFGIYGCPFNVHVVESFPAWIYIKLLNFLRGECPFVKSLDITTNNCER